MGMGLGALVTEALKVYVKAGLPIFPRLVVMISTPPAARAPHTAVAAASFNTVISLMSEGAMFNKAAYPCSSAVPKLKSDGISVSYGIPSTTINGLSEELMEEVPRILILMAAPGSPELAVISRPG